MSENYALYNTELQKMELYVYDHGYAYGPRMVRAVDLSECELIKLPTLFTLVKNKGGEFYLSYLNSFDLPTPLWEENLKVYNGRPARWNRATLEFEAVAF